jgi:hypothetical protein
MFDVGLGKSTKKSDVFSIFFKKKDDIASHLSTHFFDCTKFEIWLFLYKELCFKKGALN